MGQWQAINHTADLALHFWAASLPDLFSTTAQGMFTLFTELDTIAAHRTVDIELTAVDVEALLVAWLNELLYLYEAQGIVCVRFTFAELTPTHIRATGYGGAPGEVSGYVKAATYHNLAVQPTASGYETEIVFDT